MKIDIWSDIMCPFCYIGKRRLEGALQDFEHKEDVVINWHSFQLDPIMKSHPGVSIHDYLAERKGQTREWSLKMHQQMTENAKQEGLIYNFDIAVIANSFDAHRLIQMAKTHDLGDAAEERLFKAYFTDGKNMSDHATLIDLGSEIGLDKNEVASMLQGNDFANEVHEDIAQAQRYGINGVPFFVLDNKYGISGAQPKEVFQQAFQQAWTEQEKPLQSVSNTDGDVCIPGGDC